jgi:deoxyribonuclease V
MAYLEWVMIPRPAAPALREIKAARARHATVVSNGPAWRWPARCQRSRDEARRDMHVPIDYRKISPADAIALQEKLAKRVVRVDRLGALRHVCGVDVDYRDDGAIACAAAVLLSFPALEPLDRAIARRPVSFPYIPGLLSFREIPAALAALDALAVRPDLLFCDGHGIAHPRRCGLASHLGLLAGVPSIGIGKTRLLGEHRDPPAQRGAWVPLVDHGEEIGAALRSRAGVKPVYVSIGHRVSLATAVRLVMACSPRYRIPEPIRAADRLARAAS